MSSMLRGATSFNGDLSRWEVGQIGNMYRMFYGATFLSHQLGGAWTSISTGGLMSAGEVPWLDRMTT